MQTPIIVTLLDITSISLILLLVAIGLGVIFGVMGIINLAHGEFFMLGAYINFAVIQQTNSFWLGILLAPFLCAIFGLISEKLLFRHIYHDLLKSVLLTLGLSIVMRQAIIILFGPQTLSVTPPIDSTLLIFETSYPVYRLMVMGFSLLVLIMVFLVFYRHSFGLKLRATMADRQMAQMMGINIRRIEQLSFALGTALAGFAGGVIAPIIALNPQMGNGFLLPSFLVILIGGGLSGIVGAAFLISALQNLISYFFSATDAQITVLATAIIVMRLFPDGVNARGWRAPGWPPARLLPKRGISKGGGGAK